MITAIEIENFKGFGEMQRIEFASITLLYGQNSCGKSSVFKALFLLQNLLSTWKGDAVSSQVLSIQDLGRFRDFSHQHNEEQTIWLKLEIDWSVDSWMPDGTVPFDKKLDYFDRKLFVKFGIRGGEGGSYWCSNLDITIEKTPLISVVSTRCSDGFDTKMRFHLNNLGFWLVGCYLVESKRISVCRTLEQNDNGLPTKFQVNVSEKDLGFDASTRSPNLKRKELVAEAKELFRAAYDSILTYVFNCLNSMCYVGPLRDIPVEINWDNQVGASESWEKGLYAWKLLAHDKNDPHLLARTNEWLGKLKTKVYLENYNGLIRVRPTGFSNSVEGLRVSDVGTGISQVVPLIVSLCQRKDKIVLFEQPELHLNPIVQTELADLLIANCVNPRIGTTLTVIETHSEGIIYRLKRRLRETASKIAAKSLAIAPDSLAINHLRNTEGSTVSRVLHLDDQGEFIEPWPDDFFDLGFNERFA